MGMVVSAADANRNFSKLLSAVRDGESYVVTAHGKAVGQIIPVARNGGVARAARLRGLRTESERIKARADEDRRKRRAFPMRSVLAACHLGLG